MDTNEKTQSFEVTVEAFVAKLNARSAELAAAGKSPLYKSFGYTMGPKHARIFSICGSSRSSRAFFSRDGLIRRADSWKAAGRVLGSHDSDGAFAYVLGIYLSY